ncbi:MAG: hypothetical protein IPO94_09380 [Saprospiraceae bacterium]|nr:hypothetical protein [Saprospiraceae bacterium]
MTYQLALDCSVIGMPVLQNVVLATMSGSNGNVSNTSDQYNASNGVMNILPNGPGASQSPNLIFPNGVVGQSYTRTIRVRNGGSSVDKFMFLRYNRCRAYGRTNKWWNDIEHYNCKLQNVIRVYRFDDFTSIGNFR